MSRMIPIHIADQAVAACDAEIAKLQAENARLKAEVDQLKSQPDPLTVYLYAAELAKGDIKRLKADNARLRAAGDTLVAAYCMGDHNKERWAEYPVVREWLAAKGELP